MGIGDCGGYLKNYRPGHNWGVNLVITGGNLHHSRGAGESTMRGKAVGKSMGMT